jgi:hypothetical protein
MVFGLIMGLAVYGYGVATLVVSAGNERMAAQKVEYEAELGRLRRRNEELEAHLKAQLETECQTLFHGGIVAAAMTCAAVVGPAVVAAVKEMR